MTYEKLRKKRAKHREKIIKEFGNAHLKILTNKELKSFRTDLKDIETSYVRGGTSVCYSLGSARYYKNHLKAIVRYLKSLPWVSDCEVSNIEEVERESGDKFEWCIYMQVPSDENAVGDRYHEDYGKED